MMYYTFIIVTIHYEKLSMTWGDMWLIGLESVIYSLRVDSGIGIRECRFMYKEMMWQVKMEGKW